MDLEKTLTLEDDQHIHQQLQILASSSLPLLEALDDAVKHSISWATRINKDRSLFSARGTKLRGDSFLIENRKAVELLKTRIEQFKTKDRLAVIEPYKVSGGLSFSCQGCQ